MNQEYARGDLSKHKGGNLYQRLGVEDPELDLDYCFNESRTVKIDYVMNNSVGFWGTNASMLFKKYN